MIYNIDGPALLERLQVNAKYATGDYRAGIEKALDLLVECLRREPTVVNSTELFSVWLRDLMCRYGMANRAVSEGTGIPEGKIAAFRYAKKAPTKEEVAALARFFKVSESYLTVSARWISTPDGGYRCTACKAPADIPSRYCPHCGMPMAFVEVVE